MLNFTLKLTPMNFFTTIIFIIFWLVIYYFAEKNKGGKA